MTAEISTVNGSGALLRHGAAPLVIGHRGASDEAPENTLAAFQAAWSQGVEWVETDVQPTVDLVPVLFHDDTLERISSVAGSLRAHRLVELYALDAGSWFARHRNAEVDYSTLRIPTMYDFLTTLPPTGSVLLEIKGPHTHDQLVIELAVVRATATNERVWLQSFELDVLRHLRQAVPDRWLGLLRDDIDPDPVAFCRDLGVNSYNPDYRALLAAPHLVKPLHEAGISVVVFTSNDEADWAALTELGVDGIITDRPVALLNWQRCR